ncbi:MAG: L-threonine 3-dehydrogenase [Myxococcaceae bacterium]
MRALVKTKAEPGIWMQDVPVPEIGPNDLLIKVRKAAICGTDIHIFSWDDWSKRTIKTPLVIGHEFMGEVAEVGSAVAGFKKGDRVSGEGHITCGHCRNCRAGKRHLCRNTTGIGVNRNGAFAEYLSLPAVNAFKLPGQIPDEVAAFLDPLGNATHTALSFDLVGEDVLITGAGPIGCMAAAICRHVGARHVVVTDLNEYRLSLARKMGASLAINVKETTVDATMKQLGMTEGFDVGLEMSGNADGFRSLLGAMNHGGRVALLGIPPGEIAINWDQVIFKGLVLKGIYGREMFETWYKMAAMLQSGLNVSPIITHQFAAAEFQKAFDTMKTGQSGKIVLDWAA